MIELKRNLYGIDKNRSLMMRGICMLMIIIHHAYKNIDSSVDYLGIHSWGYIGTGIFFFFSGYGLYYSLSNRKELNYKWFLDKAKKFFLPFIIVLLSYYIVDILLGHTLEVNGLINHILTLTIPNSATWFFKVIVATYVAVYIIFGLVRNAKLRVSIVFVVTFVYFIVARHYLDGFWYNTIINFPLGMLYCVNKNCIGSKINDKNVAIALLLSFVFLLLSSSETVSSLFFTLLAVVFVLFFEVNSRLLRFMGKTSLICYLVQIVVIFFCRKLIANDFLYVAISILSTILYACLYEHALTLNIKNKQ